MRLTAKDIQVDENGCIKIAGIHDSTLSELCFRENNNFFLTLVGGYGRVSIDIVGISEFSIVNIYNGSIASEIYLWKATEVPESWSIPDGPWNTLFFKRIMIEDTRNAAKKIIERDPESFLVHITFSYGGGGGSNLSKYFFKQCGGSKLRVTMG